MEHTKCVRLLKTWENSTYCATKLNAQNRSAPINVQVLILFTLFFLLSLSVFIFLLLFF
jgi:hypothetical protein